MPACEEGKAYGLHRIEVTVVTIGGKYMGRGGDSNYQLGQLEGKAGDETKG